MTGCRLARLVLCLGAVRGVGALSWTSSSASASGGGSSSNEALRGRDLPASLAKADQVVGHLKGLMDGYVERYSAEEARFQEADASMANVVNATVDSEARMRAVDERLKLKAEHEHQLEEIAGFIKTLDAAVQAMRPATAESWMDDFPELKAKVAKIYEAHPAVLLAEKPPSVKRHERL